MQYATILIRSNDRNYNDHEIIVRLLNNTKRAFCSSNQITYENQILIDTVFVKHACVCLRTCVCVCMCILAKTYSAGLSHMHTPAEKKVPISPRHTQPTRTV